MSKYAIELYMMFIFHIFIGHSHLPPNMTPETRLQWCAGVPKNGDATPHHATPHHASSHHAKRAPVPRPLESTLLGWQHLKGLVVI
jgi:hypothetical protein